MPKRIEEGLTKVQKKDKSQTFTVHTSEFGKSCPQTD